MTMRRWIENRWALVPVAMLSLTILAAATVVTVSFSDGNAIAAEPDSYRKGAAWDDTRRQLAQNGALGWVVTPSFVQGLGDPTLARLELSVKDKHGVSIEHAAVRAEIIPILAADSRVTLTLQETQGGHYGADVPLRVNGKWEVRATIESQQRTFADRFSRVLSFARRGAAAGHEPAPGEPGS
jgi:hypothetical protein